MRRFTAVLGFPLVLVLVVSVMGPVLASPQPIPVCTFCGGGFESAAEEQDISVNVTQSTVDIEVHENGSATWTIRNQIRNGSATLRENPAQLDRIAEWQLNHEYDMLEGATVTETRMENETAVIVLRDPDAASRHAGLLVVDYLRDHGYEGSYYINVDSFTIHGPNGTVVANTPVSGAVTDNAVTWTGSVGEYEYGTGLEGSPYVMFGPDRPGMHLQAQAVVTFATLPIVGPNLLLPTVVFAALFGGVTAVFRRRWVS